MRSIVRFVARQDCLCFIIFVQAVTAAGTDRSFAPVPAVAAAAAQEVVAADARPAVAATADPDDNQRSSADAGPAASAEPAALRA